MSDTQLTLAQALDKERSVMLSTGKVLTFHQLKLVDWDDALAIYEGFLRFIAVATEYESEDDITQEYISESMPTVLGQFYISQTEMVETFLGFFTKDIEKGCLGECSINDFELIWKFIEGENRRPFNAKRIELKKLHRFQILKDVDLESLISYVSSIEQESDTTNSNELPSTTPSE